MTQILLSSSSHSRREGSFSKIECLKFEKKEISFDRVKGLRADKAC